MVRVINPYETIAKNRALARPRTRCIQDCGYALVRDTNESGSHDDRMASGLGIDFQGHSHRA